METVEIFGIAMLVLGLLLLVLDFLAYAKKRLTERYGMIWMLLAVLLIAAGILFLAAEQALAAALLILVAALVFFLFGISQTVSVLKMKNQELAMQVSLLNQENESILQELEQMRERKQDEQ